MDAISEMPTKNKRRFFFYGSVALFMLLTPIVILYSLGYTVNIQNKTISLTGGIFIKTLSYPQFKISIDGEFYKETTFLSRGALITDLAPGYHSVAIEKDGYLPWTKNVLVTAQQVAEFRFIALVPSQQNLISLATTTPAISEARFLSPDLLLESSPIQRRALLRDLSLLPAAAGASIPPAPTPEYVEWSEKEQRLIIEETDKHSKTSIWRMGTIKSGIYTELWKNPARFSITPPPPATTSGAIAEKNIARIVARPDVTDGFYLLDTAGNLYAGSAASPNLVPLIPNIQFFSVTDSSIVFIDSNDFLAESDLDGKNIRVIDRKGFFLDPRRPPQFKKAVSGAIAVLDSAGGLFIEKPGATEMESLGSGVRGMDFDGKGTKLLIWKERELFVYWLVSQEWQPRHAIGDRIKIVLWPEGEIKKAAWHTGAYEHVIFTARNGIFVSDIDDRGGLSVQRIADGTILDFSYNAGKGVLRWIDAKVISEIAL